MTLEQAENLQREMQQPTYENQLRMAYALLVDKGANALNNPHAMIGRTCGCGSCFCCAAAEVYAIRYDVEFCEAVTHGR